MRELSVNEVNEVNGGGWEDIGCSSNGSTTTCQGTLGDVADGVKDAVGALNELGKELGGWLYETFN